MLETEEVPWDMVEISRFRWKIRGALLWEKRSPTSSQTALAVVEKRTDSARSGPHGMKISMKGSYHCSVSKRRAASRSSSKKMDTSNITRDKTKFILGA